MKILFINPFLPSGKDEGVPSNRDGRRRGQNMLTFNVGLAYVASAAHREGIDIEILDVNAHLLTPEEVEHKIRTTRFDAVGIGTFVFQYRFVRDVSAMIRQYHPHVPIIVGSTLASAIPEMIIENTEVDIACIGEGDLTILDMLRALDAGTPLDDVQGICFQRNGKIVRTPPRPVISDINSIPFPDYDLFDVEFYLRNSKHIVPPIPLHDFPFDELVAMPISTTRGCPFRCTFCFHAFQGTKYRFRSPKNIVDEAQLWKEKYGANFILFWDELSFTNAKLAEGLADELIERDLGLKFFASCRSEFLNWDTFHVAEKLKKAGCQGLSFSLESGDDGILETMNKKNSVDDFLTLSRICKTLGIEAYTSVVLGYPEETLDTIDATFDALRRAEAYASVGFLQPTPATPIYQWAVENGHIGDEEEYLLNLTDVRDHHVNLTQLTMEEMRQRIDYHRSGAVKA